MNTEKLEVAICDDDPEDLQRIREMVLRCMDILGEGEVSVSLFGHARELYEESSHRPFHLVFLDIMMPEEEWSGFDLAGQLSMRKKETKVIFISNHENMVFDSYEYTPLWFVRKSLLERDMLRALRKYQQAAARKRISYRMKDGLGYREVLVHDILYIECGGHTLLVRMSDRRTYRIYGSLKPVASDLSRYGFIRVHKSYLVNPRYIEEVGAKCIRLKDGTELDMSRARRKEIVEAVERYERGSMESRDI